MRLLPRRRGTWGQSGLWRRLVDICSNSTSQGFLLSLAQQPPRAALAGGNMLLEFPSSAFHVEIYQEVPIQVGQLLLDILVAQSSAIRWHVY